MIALAMVLVAATIAMSNIIIWQFAKSKINSLNGLIKIKDESSEHHLKRYEDLFAHSERLYEKMEQFSKSLMSAREESTKNFELALDMVKSHKKTLDHYHALKTEFVGFLNEPDITDESRDTYVYCLEKLSFVCSNIEIALDNDLKKIQALQEEQDV